MNHPLLSFSDTSILALAFFVSLLLSLAFTPVVDRIARFFRIVDEPCHRKVHTECVARLGGVAMTIPLLLVVMALAVPGREMAGFLTGAVIIFIAGIVDDIKGISPGLKFCLQILAVICFMVIGGVHLKNLGDIFGLGSLALGIAGPLFTIIAMVGVINSFNLSDGLDGLAAGIAGIACLFFIPFAYDQQNWVYMIVLVSLLGAILGFIRFNSHPARLFMGDSGSLVLGFVMAASAVALTQPEAMGRGYQPVSALIILSLPIADTLYVMTSRIIAGNSPVMPDKSHIHHRLMQIGFSHQLTVSGIYCFMLGMGVIAWIIRPMPEWSQFYFVAGIYVSLFSVLYLVEEKTVRQNRPVGFNLNMSPKPGKAKNILFWIAGRSNVFYIAFWALFMLGVIATPDISAAFRHYLIFVIIFGLLFYPWRGSIIKSGIAHAVFFFGLYSLVLAQNIAFEGRTWFQFFMPAMSCMAMLWTLARVLNTRRIRVLWPGSFEVLLLGMAMVTPVILHYSVFIGFDFRWQMWISFLQVLPFFMLNKAYLRRNPGKISKYAAFLLVCLLLMFV